MPSSPRRRAARIALAVLALGVASGCGPAQGPTAFSASPVPSSSSSAGSGASSAGSGAAGSEVPSVPVHSADLADQPAEVAVPPVSVRIPAHDIAVPVDPVGVQADGQMEIPPLAERGGWYRFGAAPGDGAGTAVIAAHVDSIASAGLGPFARLKDLAVGDAVKVTMANGTRHDYVVRTVVRVAKPEIRWQDIFVRDGAPRLVLVTCGGTFRPSVGHYADNVIVTADPVGRP
jgi:LPXTG-site transpeptidase (sortase) family protein